MEILFLLKIGEIFLKKGNKPYFEKMLRKNISEKLDSVPHRLYKTHNRFFLETDNSFKAHVEQVLATTFGISSFAKTWKVKKQIEEISRVAGMVAKENIESHHGTRYKVEARRSDKGFPYNSMEINSIIGKYLNQQFSELEVDVHNPEWIVQIEIREHAYIYAMEKKGAKGLPVGTNSKGVALLSGGIDSPVAAYLMGKRGLAIETVYFHTYPYTSEKAEQKVETLAEKLAVWFGNITLMVVPFTESQMHIQKNVEERDITLIMRAAMIYVSDRIAKNRNAHCLITGESLGQVASQTTDSMRFTGSFTDLPLFRPLIGNDKEEIVELAKHIDTYETSILPYEDCCVLFSPKHPNLRPEFQQLREIFSDISITQLLNKAAEERVIKTFS